MLHGFELDIFEHTCLNFPEKADENAFPEVLGGDQAKQVEAVRAYLLTFGRGAATTGAPAGAGGR